MIGMNNIVDKTQNDNKYFKKCTVVTYIAYPNTYLLSSDLLISTRPQWQSQPTTYLFSTLSCSLTSSIVYSFNPSILSPGAHGLSSLFLLLVVAFFLPPPRRRSSSCDAVMSSSLPRSLELNRQILVARVRSNFSTTAK